MLVHAWLVTALNPKGIVFFVAFLPQFLDPARPATPQMVVLGGTFLVMAVVNAGLYALAAATMRGAMQRPSLIRAVNRVGGSFLVGAGLLTAATRRN
jgi:threonine/homoserine/homoserine lactone efflux protein